MGAFFLTFIELVCLLLIAILMPREGLQCHCNTSYLKTIIFYMGRTIFTLASLALAINALAFIILKIGE